MMRRRKAREMLRRKAIRMAREMARVIRTLDRKTGPDTAHRQTDSIRETAQSSGKVGTFLLLCLLGSLMLLSPAYLSAQDKNLVLSESGIHYPDGFDANTVGIVQGRVSELFKPANGPVQFLLNTGRDHYTVIAAPSWFWNDLDVKVSVGTEVKVRGSKSMGRDGKLYIIGQEMEVLSTGKVYVFREDDGYPLWKGGRAVTRGSGFGSPQKRGGGFGEMGRGRR